MRILLIDFDGKMPNLALMKLSTYHKQKGNEVGFNIGDPDIVYISTIFDGNKSQLDGLRKMFNCPVEIGGSGYSLNKKLPNKIEHLMPDYDLYNYDYSMGFTTRGCIRNCPFCIVRQKEGFIRANADIYEFWNPKHKHIILLDNNILALPDHFKRVANQIMENNLSVDFNQGLDIRLINDGNAKILSELTVRPEYRFAFDDPKLENIIRKKVPILKKYGINRGFFYVLVGFNTTFEEDLHRIEVLKELNQRAFIMRYKTVRDRQPYIDLARWINHCQYQMIMGFEDFWKIRHDENYLEVKPCP